MNNKKSHKVEKMNKETDFCKAVTASSTASEIQARQYLLGTLAPGVWLKNLPIINHMCGISSIWCKGLKLSVPGMSAK